VAAALAHSVDFGLRRRDAGFGESDAAHWRDGR
jgi:hypothetical protein